MSTIVYRQAKLFVNGVELSAALSELNATYSAAMLDATTFGADTKINRAGLLTAQVSGKGYLEDVLGADEVMFNDVGSTSPLSSTDGDGPAYQGGIVIEDAIILVFPDGITEGATTTGMGYALKGVLSQFMLGGAVGVLTPISFQAESRGIS